MRARRPKSSKTEAWSGRHHERVVFAALVVLVFIGLIFGANSSGAKSSARACADVRGLAVAVEKGRVSCKAARVIVKRFIAVSGNCGGAMKPACVVKRFHCRAASPGEASLVGYCYRLKKPTPAAQDFSFYKPKHFRASITLKPKAVQSSERQHMVSSPSCSMVRSDADMYEAAEQILGAEEGTLGEHDLVSTFRYPRFGLGTVRRNSRTAFLRARARPFRAPAGLQGSGTIQHLRYGRLAIEAGCKAFLKVLRVRKWRGCIRSYNPGPGKPDYGDGYICQNKWWPADGPNCRPYGGDRREGIKVCERVIRTISLGKPFKVRIPSGPKNGVQLHIEVPNFIIPGQCVCMTRWVSGQSFGSTNTVFLR